MSWELRVTPILIVCCLLRVNEYLEKMFRGHVELVHKRTRLVLAGDVEFLQLPLSRSFRLLKERTSIVKTILRHLKYTIYDEEVFEKALDQVSEVHACIERAWPEAADIPVYNILRHLVEE